MITTTWTAAPAGYLGLGGSDVRPDVARRPQTALGTAVPFARNRKVVVPAGAERLVEGFGSQSDFGTHNCMAPNDGTTLGIHSSGRPQS